MVCRDYLAHRKIGDGSVDMRNPNAVRNADYGVIHGSWRGLVFLDHNRRLGVLGLAWQLKSSPTLYCVGRGDYLSGRVAVAVRRD